MSNGSVDVPNMLFKPIAVTRENVASVIIAGGFYTVKKVCTTEYRQVCQRAGIS